MTVFLRDYALDASRLVKNQKIGEGGMGAVYAGTYDGKPVAIKTALAGVSDSEFQCEAASQAQIPRHRSVVAFIGFVFSPPAPASMMVAELLVRGSLNTILRGKNKEKMSLTRKLKIALDVAEGLEAIHLANIIHSGTLPEPSPPPG